MNKKLVMIFMTAVFFFSFISCSKSGDDVFKQKYVHKYRLSVSEPSDLCLSEDGSSLWTVSDEKNKAYLISFKGKVLKELNIHGRDPEGITLIDDKTLCVSLESTSELSFMTTDGKEIRKIKIPLKSEQNSGLEGVFYDNSKKIFYLINEKDPAMLVFLDSQYRITKKMKLNISHDLSAVTFYKKGNQLWLLSDEDSAVLICDPEGNLLKKIKIDIPKPEGIAIDEKAGKFYVVSDSEGILYEFDLN